MRHPEKNKWNMTKVLAPVMLVTHFCGITSPPSKPLRVFWFFYRLFILGLCILIFIHEIPSVKYWHKNSNAYKSRKINAVVGMKNSDLALPEPVQAKIFKFNVIHIVLNISAIVIYNVLGHAVTWRNANFTSYTCFIYMFIDLVILICAIEYTQMINLLNENFKNINCRLKHFKKQVKSARKSKTALSSKGSEIVKLRRSHLFLARTSAEVNSCFSVQILLLIIYSMIEIIYALRSLVGGFSIPDVEESLINIISDIFWLLPYSGILMQLITFSERTSTESKRTITVVHHFMNLFYFDKKTIKELEVFAMQITQHPVVFTIRFFDLDYPFLNTVISSLATYFIIIVTFQGETDSGVFTNWNFKNPAAGDTTVMPTSTANTIF